MIDTNVFISALRSRQGSSYKLMQLIGTGKFELFISVALLFEYEDVAKKDITVTISDELIDKIIDYICAVGIETEIFYLWRPFLTDPKDDFVLELAVNSLADYIITFNKKDFRKIEQLGLNVLSPKEFLETIGEL